MMFKKKANAPSQLSLVIACGVCLVSGLAALAQADFKNAGLARVDKDLQSQIKLLSQTSEPWASAVKNRIEFAQIKVNNALTSNNYAIENMHLNHACKALMDARAILIQTQFGEPIESKLIEDLIEQTFLHREILGCIE